MKTEVIILAGGDHPIPRTQIIGRPFIEWVVDYLHQIGFDSFHICGYHAGPTVNIRQGTKVRYYNEPNPMGTAGALTLVSDFGANPTQWLVVKGDRFTFPNWAKMLHGVGSEENQADMVVVGIPQEHTGECSRFLRAMPSGRLIQVQPVIEGPGIADAGIYMIHNSLLDKVPFSRPLSLTRQLIPYWLKMGIRIQVELTNQPFLRLEPELQGLKKLAAEQFVHLFMGR